MDVANHLKVYAQRIRDLRRANADVPETALAPAFQQLVEALLPLLPAAPRLTVLPEYRSPGVGRPDIALVKTGAPPRAFLELKAPGKPADPTRWRSHDKRQFERFSELRCWATCNFSELRLFDRNEEEGAASVVPERALHPDQTDARADKAIAGHDPAPFLRLLERLAVGAGQQPSARDAEHLAELLAHSARLVREIVRDRLGELNEAGKEHHALIEVRETFRDVLYAHPEAAGYPAKDFDQLFSAAFSQTLAFGLLLVREATGQAAGPDAWQKMPEEHPLMRTALRVLSQEEIVADVGIGFSVLCDTVNSFAPEILVAKEGRADPILYFYENFLETFNPDDRQKYGVYYTPIEVVRYMTSALDRALRDRLGMQGLYDTGVTILDPATGTGTFLMGIAELVRTKAEEGGAGMGALALRNLAERMFGFELLVGPYAVAHYRLHHVLRRPARKGDPPLDLPRLGVYLADTLAEPGAVGALGRFGFIGREIEDERARANEIKQRTRILAIMGNPPYRRLEEGENHTLVGRWMDELWDDLKAPVRNAGQGNQLNTFPELSVAFWRWAIWKLFEAENAPRRGVVAFISNRKFLTGWPYAGLRQMMRQRFDRIEIVDLRGDVRRGERAGVDSDQGVFNIQVGTAITLAIADGSKRESEAADVYYQDSWAAGFFSKKTKLDWLATGAQGYAIEVRRGLLDDMRPEPFSTGEWASVREGFAFASSGLESKRDHIVYASTRRQLEEQVRHVLSLTGGALDETFNATPMNSAGDAKSVGWADEWVKLAAYRPLDRRWHYAHANWNDRPRPELSKAWGSHNICLFTLPNGTGAGPATWCFNDYPDRHAFRGSYGGYAFPLYDRRLSPNAINLSQGLMAHLGAAYGEDVSAEQVFDAILCLLSAASYTLRFAEDLEDTFPHVAFPAEPGVFREAARIGREIRAVETFERPAAASRIGPGFVRVETEPRGNLASVEFVDGMIVLCSDGTGRISGIPLPIWEFAVSGYRLVPRWLEARTGLPADHQLVTGLRDICGRIAELIELFAAADKVLEATLQHTLTRDALGFGEHEAEPDAGRE